MSSANKTVAILQSNYIPWKGYFDIINSVDEFIIYDDVQYTKNDWRNRNKIKTQTGLQWITIPVRHESLSQKINETKVVDNSWSIKHWRTICQAYGKSPFFNSYKQLFEEHYLKTDTTYLTDINVKFIAVFNRILNIQTKISLSSDYKLIKGKTERLVDLVQQAGGTKYLSGPAAQAYLNKSVFKEAGIEIAWMDYSGYKPYNQQFAPFEHEVSIIDLIFNEGPGSTHFMKSFNP